MASDDAVPPDTTPNTAGLAFDPLHQDPRLAEHFGHAYPQVARFATMLADQGVVRGLIGPRELPRLWERHIVNSAAVLPFLGHGSIADVGSGAGLPGIVLAAMVPEREVTLIEPMERRCRWLIEVVEECGLANVRVLRGRAEEYADQVSVDAVTARAVASVDKLVKWCAPLLAAGGHMAFLKGSSAQAELDKAVYTLRRHRLVGTVHEAPTLPGLEPTTVVTLARPAPEADLT